MKIIDFVLYQINLQGQFCDLVFAKVFAKVFGQIFPHCVIYFVRESQEDGKEDGKEDGREDGREDGIVLKNLYFRANTKTIHATFFKCGTPVFYKSKFIKKS